jgi:DNA ligase D-like protein (predicted 3'-phosphoesterase)
MGAWVVIVMGSTVKAPAPPVDYLLGKSFVGSSSAMPSTDALRRYREKRDFRRTSEPRGRRRRGRGQPRFVVQKHDASRLHYDFRLEADGVLKSWAVPKGPSTDPRDKRLAVPTEDHPLDYLDFEGVIPEGQYGAGPVIVWDTGTYRNLTEDNGEPVPVEEAIRRGHLVIWLEGEKLRGGYALTHIRKGEAWLLVKMRDEGADARRNPVRTEPRSVLSARTIEEVAEHG